MSNKLDFWNQVDWTINQLKYRPDVEKIFQQFGTNPFSVIPEDMTSSKRMPPDLLYIESLHPFEPGSWVEASTAETLNGWAPFPIIVTGVELTNSRVRLYGELRGKPLWTKKSNGKFTLYHGNKDLFCADEDSPWIFDQTEKTIIIFSRGKPGEAGKILEFDLEGATTIHAEKVYADISKIKKIGDEIWLGGRLLERWHTLKDLMAGHDHAWIDRIPIQTPDGPRFITRQNGMLEIGQIVPSSESSQTWQADKIISGLGEGNPNLSSLPAGITVDYTHSRPEFLILPDGRFCYVDYARNKQVAWAVEKMDPGTRTASAQKTEELPLSSHFVTHVPFEKISLPFAGPDNDLYYYGWIGDVVFTMRLPAA